MEKQHGNKIKVLLVSALLVVGLMSGPVRADHEHSDNVIAPLAGLLILGALLNHNHNYYKGSRRYYGHNGHRHGHHQGHRAHSYSTEGYGRKSKRGYGHKSNRGYGHKSKRIYRR